MKESIGLGVFAYNRPSHLKRVLYSIINNKIKSFHLFIDGPKNKNDLENIKTINFIAKEMNKKKFQIFIHNQKKNIGLKKSIIYGADKLSQKYDKFIIIEDDCVIYKNFFSFMKKNLKLNVFQKYDIAAIYAFQFNEIQDKKMSLHSLLVSNFIPWGWGTLSNNWINFRKSKKKYLKSKNYFKNLKTNKNFWSKDFINYNYNKNLRYIVPSINLVKNIGFDGTGVNSVATSVFNTKEKIPNLIEINKLIIDDKLNLKHQNHLYKKANLFY